MRFLVSGIAIQNICQSVLVFRENSTFNFPRKHLKGSYFVLSGKRPECGELKIIRRERIDQSAAIPDILLRLVTFLWISGEFDSLKMIEVLLIEFSFEDRSLQRYFYVFIINSH